MRLRRLPLEGAPPADRRSRVRGGRLGEVRNASRQAMKQLRIWIGALLTCTCLAAAQAQGVRPEVGKPLQQAADLLKAGKAREALAKAREADAVAGKTPGEQLMIDRMKASAA